MYPMQLYVKLQKLYNINCNILSFTIMYLSIGNRRFHNGLNRNYDPLSSQVVVCWKKLFPTCHCCCKKIVRRKRLLAPVAKSVSFLEFSHPLGESFIKKCSRVWLQRLRVRGLLSVTPNTSRYERGRLKKAIDCLLLGVRLRDNACLELYELKLSQPPVNKQRYIDWCVAHINLMFGENWPTLISIGAWQRWIWKWLFNWTWSWIYTVSFHRKQNLQN